MSSLNSAEAVSEVTIPIWPVLGLNMGLDLESSVDYNSVHEDADPDSPVQNCRDVHNNVDLDHESLEIVGPT